MNIVGPRMKGHGDGHCAGLKRGRWACPMLEGGSQDTHGEGGGVPNRQRGLFRRRLLR